MLVFGGPWRSAVEIGLFRMINFVENGPINMCRTISSSDICPSLSQDTNTDEIKLNNNGSYGTILQFGNTFPWFPENIRKQVEFTSSVYVKSGSLIYVN